ncbi:MAG: methyltransferase domain-containing protein [Lachnospiraceae bacterium]|nr:methyltransferase domain-containing protein [Lachnospiraceae bacterium]
MKNYYGIIEYAHHFIRRHVDQGDICVDATAGNGHDTLFLCELVGENGKVIAMDIQEIAVNHTKKLLRENAFEGNAKVILDSHENIGKYAREESVSCIVFNLGYLPGGNHALATKAKSTITAMEASLQLLKKNGLLSVTIYSGGDSGFEEKNAVLEWMKQLDAKKYLVIVSEYYNRPNHPPIPVQIIRLK